MKQAPSVIVLTMDFGLAQKVTINEERVNCRKMKDGAVYTHVDGNQTLYIIDKDNVDRPSFSKTLKHVSNSICTIPAGTKSTEIQTFPNAQLAYIATPKNV